jgi:hypothetical protein
MASGFNNTPTPNSEYHRHQSWGRTREPKNINGSNQTPVALTVCTNLANATNGVGNCITENQRFLHITTSAASSLVNIWVYTHASGVWAELKTLANVAHTMNASEHKIIEISGIDKVAFNITGTVHAAASTF